MKIKIFKILIALVVMIGIVGITASAETGDNTETYLNEAVWGTSATDLGGDGREGYLHDALLAASMDPTISYIKLNCDAYGQQYYFIQGGNFTLDLNGKSIITVGGGSVLEIASGNINITSTAPGATITTEAYADGMLIYGDASVTVDNVKIIPIRYGVNIDNNAEFTLGANASIYTDSNSAIIIYGGKATVKGIIDTEYESYEEIFVSAGVVDVSECKSRDTLLICSGNHDSLPIYEVIIVAQGERLVNFDTKEEAENFIYNEYYEFPVYYNVSFDVSEGDEPIDPVSVYKNKDFILPSYDLAAPAGKVFVGWTVDGDPESKIYNSGDTITVTGNITVSPTFVDDGVYVGGIKLSGGKYLAVGADTPTATKPAGGYAYYKDGVLTLNNYTYTGEGYLFETAEYDDGTAQTYHAMLYSDFGIDIKVVGASSLISSYSSAPETAPEYSGFCAIVIRGRSLGIEGGMLTLSSVNDGAIDMKNGGDFTVKNTKLVISSYENTLDSDGIDINGDGSLTVDNSTLIMNVSEDAVELEYNGYVVIIDSTVDITAGDDGIEIDDEGAISIENSILVAKCDYVPLKSGSVSRIYITDSKVTLTSSNDAGIYVHNNVDITNSDVAVTAKTYGIVTDDFSIIGEKSALSITAEQAALATYFLPYFSPALNFDYTLVSGDLEDSVTDEYYEYFFIADEDGKEAKTLTISPTSVQQEESGIGAGLVALITAASVILTEALVAALIYIFVLKRRKSTSK